MMATLWKPSYRNVRDSVDWEAQVFISPMNHTEVRVWEVEKYMPLFLLRLIVSEEICEVLGRLLHCC